MSGWGERIRAARIDLGLSQRELATRMGLSRPTVASWESEETSPDLADVPRLSRALRVSPAWLVFGRTEAA